VLADDQRAQSEVGRGTLLLADISGYTAFLQAVGEAHAADMAEGPFVPEAYPLLTSLLDGVVESIAPPFVLSKLEGDAVFAFGPDGQLSVRGQSVVDCLTACYGTYRTRLDEARELMICDCNACVSINGLELKFVLHHGAYIMQSVAGHRELFGPDATSFPGPPASQKFGKSPWRHRFTRKQKGPMCGPFHDSPGWTRTSNPPVNSRFRSFDAESCGVTLM